MILSTCPLHTISRCGTREAHMNWSMVMSDTCKGRTHPFVTGTTCGLLALFQRGLSAVCLVITYSGVWINRVRLPILLVVS